MSSLKKAFQKDRRQPLDRLAISSIAWFLLYRHCRYLSREKTIFFILCSWNSSNYL